MLVCSNQIIIIIFTAKTKIILIASTFSLKVSETLKNLRRLCPLNSDLSSQLLLLPTK